MHTVRQPTNKVQYTRFFKLNTFNNSYYVRFTVKLKLALVVLILLLALQLYRAASSCSKLQITKMDWTKVFPFATTSSS